MIKPINLDDNYKIKEYSLFSGEKLKTLESAHATQSITSCQKNEIFDLIDPYIKLYDIIPNISDNANSILVLGGGAFTYPKYFLSKYKNKTMDVVEINEILYKASLEHFYLADAINLFDPTQERFHVYICDAYDYIKQDRKYDAIFVDLYEDNEPLHKTFEKEVITQIKSLLTPGGYLFINYIKSDANSEILRDEMKIATQEFTYAKIITNDLHYKANHGNILIILSENNIILPNGYDYKEIPLEIILSDNKTL